MWKAGVEGGNGTHTGSVEGNLATAKINNVQTRQFHP